MNPLVNRRTVLSMTFASVAGLVVAGCSSNSSATEDGSATGSHAEEGAFPVTIEHKLGSTTIESAPTRIAAVGIGDADVLLALGLTPVLVPVWKGSTDDGIGVWAEPSVTGADPTALENATTEFDVETIAAAAPDLIIAVNNAIDESLYAQLSEIAPTVLHAADQTDWVLPWQEVTARIGRSVGLPAEAATEVTRIEELVAQARTDNSQFVGKTAALVIRWSDGNLRAFSPTSARAQLLTALGFEPPAALAERFEGKLNTELSAESYSLLECDYLLFDNYELARAEMESQATFTNLQVVRDGGLIGLDPIVSDAVSMPNPLTIPFVLSAFVDRINEADAAR
ncbi:ABC transporter substrate-binding protein [Rhodococcoides kyotonense]|uniref:Iron complex transport system substrate-binding protein n=1 Tax=Rhodococcoides kyotonense TaxID=398843 RepID=A0A239H3T4_9NOCA|nr:ABC transporter substrate-binding protein [Rhodococcus kyotonensis]SNS76037.1 iron complex transport system substrate-binding protein [Rhodococcus kyotonensis]